MNVVDPETGLQKLDELEDQRDFEPPEVEKRVTSPDSNRKILEELRKYADEHEKKCGRFPKTLIFADNDLPHTSHADELVNIAVDVFGRGQSFVRKITGRVDRPLQRIREFRNRPEPGIVVSVDLMSTGVDIPDLEYIVFLRESSSRTCGSNSSCRMDVGTWTRGKQFVQYRTRLEQQNHEALHAYSAFISEDPEYVLNELIDGVLTKDKDFVKWRTEHSESFAPRTLAARRPKTRSHVGGRASAPALSPSTTAEAETRM